MYYNPDKTYPEDKMTMGHYIGSAVDVGSAMVNARV